MSVERKPITCAVDGCAVRVHARDFCQRHYNNFWRHGNPTRPNKRAAAGAGSVRGDGYRIVRTKLEHVVIAERVLGKPLPAGAEVHHMNGEKSDNRNENLVICPSRAYHMLLHQRARALEACGNPTWRKCHYCKSWDDPVNMRGTSDPYHPHCAAAYQRKRREPQNNRRLPSNAI